MQKIEDLTAEERENKLSNADPKNWVHFRLKQGEKISIEKA